MNRDILGLSEVVWALAEQCWDRDPSNRPHIADILLCFETASRDWVSPTLEAIANLNLDFPIDPLPPTPESDNVMSKFNRENWEPVSKGI